MQWQLEAVRGRQLACWYLVVTFTLYYVCIGLLELDQSEADKPCWRECESREEDICVRFLRNIGL